MMFISSGYQYSSWKILAFKFEVLCFFFCVGSLFSILDIFGGMPDSSSIVAFFSRIHVSLNRPISSSAGFPILLFIQTIATLRLANTLTITFTCAPSFKTIEIITQPQFRFSSPKLYVLRVFFWNALHIFYMTPCGNKSFTFMPRLPNIPIWTINQKKQVLSTSTK